MVESEVEQNTVRRWYSGALSNCVTDVDSILVPALVML